MPIYKGIPWNDAQYAEPEDDPRWREALTERRVASNRAFRREAGIPDDQTDVSIGDVVRVLARRICDG
ncbi:MAG TPA: hypothetical protein PKA95_08460 [Thermomicrobiales bacterium]|nr:hypothetical protein [Thermomicrobiales bacterium]